MYLSIIISLLASFVTAVPRTLTDTETVRQYLNSGGDELIRKHLNLPEHVAYNPLLHMSVDHAPYRAGHPQFGQETLSDIEVLRQFGYYVPGIDSEKSLLDGTVLKTTLRQSRNRMTVRGKQSVFIVTYSGFPPEESKEAFLYALRIWADVFPCKVPLRVQFSWHAVSGGRTLAAAISPFTVFGQAGISYRLRPDAAYTPTMAAAISGRDIQRLNYHISISFNSLQPWHFRTDVPARQMDFDFTTVAIHEICHGLFFTGALQAARGERKGFFQSEDNIPGRFDQFIQTSSGVGIARSCNRNDLYLAMTRRGLSFRTTSGSNSTFQLYAPKKYKPGSSTYHFDNLGLRADCARLNIRDCSNLMTFELNTGYTQHKLGEPTLQVMRTVLGESSGLVRSKCVVPPALAPNANPQHGILDGTTNVGPFTVKKWVVIVAGCVAAVGAAVVVFFIVTAFARR